MKLLILTTNTDHHNYFLNRLKINDSNLFVIYEKKKIKNLYKRNHKLLYQKANYEKKIFNNLSFKRNLLKINIFDLNSDKAINCINEISPNIIILFGTNILNKKFLNKIKTKTILNLHGGDPEHYRGLDSIFWTIFHNDYKRLFTTLHKVNSKVDTGDIFEKIKIQVNKKTTLLNIGVNNTNNCIKLVNKYIFRKKNKNKIFFRKQNNLGRYYSAIPKTLIDICNKNLKNYVKKKN